MSAIWSPIWHKRWSDVPGLARRATESFFKECGLAVETAPNGVMAVQWVQDNADGVIFVGRQMPGMAGCESTRCIRE